MEEPKTIMNSLSRIGNTDLIKLQKLPEALKIKTQIYVKSENYNPTGNLTDRFAKAGLELLQSQKDLKNGSKIFSNYTEDLSKSLAFVAKNLDFELTIVYNEKVEKKRIDMLRALGANLVFSNDLNHGLELSKNSEGEFFDSFFEENKNELEIRLSEELKTQLSDFDHIFISEKNSFCYKGDDSKLVRVELSGNLNKQDTQEVKLNDAIKTSRLLINNEGILTGKKSGMILSGALNFLREKELTEKEDLKIIVVLEDSLNLQESLIINENNLISRRVLTGLGKREELSYSGKNNFSDFSTLKQIAYYDNRLTVGDCYDLLKERLAFVPIRKEGKIFGVIDQKSLLKNVIVKNLDKNNSCIECVRKDFFMVDYDVPFTIVEKMLEVKDYVVVVKRMENGNISNVYGICINDIVSLIDQDMEEIV